MGACPGWEEPQSGEADEWGRWRSAGFTAPLALLIDRWTLSTNRFAFRTLLAHRTQRPLGAHGSLRPHGQSGPSPSPSSPPPVALDPEVWDDHDHGAVVTCSSTPHLPDSASDKKKEVRRLHLFTFCLYHDLNVHLSQ
ncbi:hypothetical protein CEXT_693641 [Caerostris extrusa]|uniref:Uncharacterized protein n=1 Tax=Caerostris extrusa TaxID=172846 RepID=A0AAV4XYG1_CAEEX|nr:hypothetical protein CEXT_693641 [Caerostris extrusa]